MGIPDEDLGPRWLRDYRTMYDYNIAGRDTGGADSGTGVRVDMPAMEEFAAALQRNVDDDYHPHARKVFDEMMVQPEGQLNFLELWWALEQHDTVKVAATDNVANQGNGAKIFAFAADEISKRYQQSDAYAAARLQDVQQYLGTTPDQPPTTTPTNPGESV